MVRASVRGSKRCEAATWGQQHVSESGVMQSLGYRVCGESAGCVEGLEMMATSVRQWCDVCNSMTVTYWFNSAIARTCAWTVRVTACVCAKYAFLEGRWSSCISTHNQSCALPSLLSYRQMHSLI